MGKGRKSKYISKITSDDEKMLKAFCNVGYLNSKMLKENLSVADKRITNFQRDNYIEKVSYLNKETKNAEFAYRLSAKGKSLCSDMLNVQKFYRSSSPNHDLCLADNYLALKEELRELWITENQWRDRFQEHLDKLYTQNYEHWEELNDMWHNKLISCPDGGFITEEGKEIALEVTTDSYSQKELQAKEIFVKTLNIKYRQIRA